MAANRDEKSAFDDLISVREAASILHVSESTVWRWIGRGILKAHRVGPKRVCLRRDELEPVLRPVVEEKLDRDAMLERDRFPRPRPKSNLSFDEILARAKAHREEILADRGGVPLPSSWILINEARDERSDSF